METAGQASTEKPEEASETDEALGLQQETRLRRVGDEDSEPVRHVRALLRTQTAFNRWGGGMREQQQQQDDTQMHGPTAAQR